MQTDINAFVVSHGPLDELTLKRLLLIFDKVHIANPIENRCLIPADVAEMKYPNMRIKLFEYCPLFQGEKFQKEEEELLNKIDYAYSKGYLVVEDLARSNFYKKFWLPLRLAYDFDTGNKALLDLTLPLLQKKAHERIGNGMIRGGFIEQSGYKVYPDIPPIPQFVSKEDDELYKLEIQAFSIIGRLNRGLTVANEINAVPVFNNPSMIKLFAKKMEIAKLNSDRAVVEGFKKVNNFELQSVQHLLYKTSEVVLPDDILEKISIKELIIAREKSYHKLLKLRRGIRQSVDFISAHSFAGSDFNMQMQKHINQYLIPQYVKLNSEYRDLLAIHLKIPVTFISAAVGTGVGICQLLDPAQVVFFSAISATVGNYVSDLAKYILDSKNKKFRNTYSYFLDYH